MSQIKRKIMIIDEEAFSSEGLDKIHRKEMPGKRTQTIHHIANSIFLYKSFEIDLITFE